MAAAQTKSAATKQPYINPHESLSGLARFFSQELKNQAVDQGVKRFVPDAVNMVRTAEIATPRSGDLAPGEVLNLSKLREREDVKQRRESLNTLPGIDYRREIVHGTEMIHGRQATELDRKIQEVMVELKRLVDSSQTISNEYLQMAVDQKPVSAGTYHLNFFDFMLSVIRSARQKVEDSGAWLQVSKKKNGFQQKAQSLGTKFTMSHERSAVTQTG
jgi:hypothetical protein